MDYDYDISDIFSALKLDDEYFAGPRTVVKRSAADAKSSEEPPEKRQRKKYDYLSCLESLSDSDDSDDGPADIDPEILAFITERQKPVDTDDVKWNDDLKTKTMGLGDASTNLYFLDEDDSITALDESEIDILKKYASLYRVWGYRRIDYDTHDAYEEEIHRGPKYGGLTPNYYHYLTNFSDVVFRTLENIDNDRKGEVGRDFGYLKLRAAATEDLPKGLDLNNLHILLDRYMKEKDTTRKTMFEIMQELSNEPLKHRTFAFAAVVFAAKALLAIYEGNYDVARNIAMLYVYRFNKS